MSGEINATNVIIEDATGDIVGQGEMTVTWNGNPIDISNKSFGDYITLLDAELGSKQLQIAGTFVYNDDAQFRAMREAAIDGTQAIYTVSYTSAATTDESFSASMVPTALSDALPPGDKVSTSLTLLSSGTVTYIAAVT